MKISYLLMVIMLLAITACSTVIQSNVDPSEEGLTGEQQTNSLSENKINISAGQNSTVEPNKPATGEDQGSQDLKLTTALVAEHNSNKDCWIAYEGKVYDITDFLLKHKAPLDKFCGTTGVFEKAFTEQHGNSKVAVLEAEGIYKGALSSN